MLPWLTRNWYTWLPQKKTALGVRLSPAAPTSQGAILRLLLAIFLTILASFVTLPATSASFFWSSKTNNLTITDDFVFGDSKLLSRLIKKNGAPDLIRLSSDGGDFSEAIGIGIQVHELKIPTETIGPCFSSCAYIWLAGSEFTIGAGSIVGIHAPANVYLDESKTEINNYIDAGWYLGYIRTPLAATKNFLSIANLESMFDITASKLDVLGYVKVDDDTFKAP
jgi:hypothetical protein